MKYQVTFFVKIDGKTEAIVVRVDASTEYLAVAQATLKYKRMFPVGNETFEAVEVVPRWIIDRYSDLKGGDACCKGTAVSVRSGGD